MWIHYFPVMKFLRSCRANDRALKQKGFGIIADIDVAATLKAKLDIDHRPYCT